ncbi:gallate dioxygenase [Pusillimonas sp. CC-YST705]|uniref:Gallate dioxygenase n=1 Tax=Mesopusillimonas faecipullorum TaxID=2755040 RepID=A0ABS8C964_9BURK|nr:gallate dioxygenase [Mesopusillimonas faecipullorum]MCB5362572.1 gallate dioxygenase [Mesopusillimonas faecipullorum]
MARIIGAIAASHTPTIGFAVDGDKRQSPAWAPIFEAFEPVQQWLEQRKPDVLFLIFNDHITSFFFDHYSAFALGVGESYGVADEGGGPRDLPAVPGHAALARHIGQSLMSEEFDMSFFQGKSLDHGCFSPLSMMNPPKPDWTIPIVPLQVGVLQFPIPTARRCYKLGQALRRAIESYPEDLKVAIVATGGLSHQVHGERAGFNNVPWDQQFLDLIEKDPEYLASLTQAEYAELGGLEGAEIIMWLVMRGALSANVRKVHQSYCLPSMTGIATAIYENEAVQTPLPSTIERHRRLMALQLEGAERLAGTYPFGLERSVRAYRINHFLHNLIDPVFRAAFLADEETAFRTANLTEEESALIRNRDWRGMIHYGVIFFMLEKLGAVVGVSNLHIYAAMRGQALDEFLQTRNAPDALYSVAGKEAGKQTWDN